jgi:hypothetical protein
MRNNIEIFEYLHDTGVSAFNFDFQNRKAMIDFLLWDDIKKKEVKLSLTLIGISKFNSYYEQNIDFNVIGCHDAKCIPINETQYEVTLLFDFLKQAVAWKVTMNFEKVEIKGGLSKKSFEYKYGEQEKKSSA